MFCLTATGLPKDSPSCEVLGGVISGVKLVAPKGVREERISGLTSGI